MNERIKNLLKILKDGEYKQNRYSKEITVDPKLFTSDSMRSALIFKAMLESETPYLHEGDTIGFNRKNREHFKAQNADGEWEIEWCLGNIVPDYETVLSKGFLKIKEEIESKLTVANKEALDFYNPALITLDAALKFAAKYRDFAKENSSDKLYNALCRVPFYGATNLYEACVFVKFLVFTLRCNRNCHVTLGRFDKYMRPFYQKDLKRGASREELFDTVQEFFLSLNFDTDIYQGVQQGDNGQSLVLGGNGSFDDFSHLCMEASLELSLIDPKINLRVDKNTPDELYEFGTLMTKQGMGFPQYSNDDIVIPGLINLGYAPEDAADYAVAACWEFIVPGKAMDIPNIETFNYPKVVNKTLFETLNDAQSFDGLMECMKRNIAIECDELMAHANTYQDAPSPYYSTLVQGCVERGKDLAHGGAVYNNMGIHGAGIATATDSLFAVKDLIFDKKEVTKEQLLDALDKNFEGYGELRNTLLGCNKMGNNIAEVDSIAYELMDTFGGYLNGKPNSKGGIFRAGTGSAHEYYYSAKKVGATADGRLAFAPYGSSFSPSLEARLNGPLSCIKSFTGFDLTKVINGGPMTIELHDTVFRNEEGIKKVAALVKAFVTLGGHQLQLNSINREILLDAMEHPENHKNLIVRVWGWSGYFVELDIQFREHILKRTEFTV